MDRKEAVQQLESLISECPVKEKPVLQKIGLAMMEYADYEMGSVLNSINQKLNVLENKIDFFYNPKNCPKCGSNHLLKVISPREERGKTYCKGCGLVI